jgi:hypothetical protein
MLSLVCRSSSRQRRRPFFPLFLTCYQRFHAPLHFPANIPLPLGRLQHKRFVLRPDVLRAYGIPVCRLVQRPGDMVITAPGAFHWGFNTGFNVAEATNLATKECVVLAVAVEWLWLGEGRARAWDAGWRVRQACVGGS